MFIVWGSKNTEKNYGGAGPSITCDHCHNTSTFNLVKYGHWFTLYFIPIFPLKIQFRAECPVCRYGFNVEKERAKEILTLMGEKKV